MEEMDDEVFIYLIDVAAVAEAEEDGFRGGRWPPWSGRRGGFLN